MAEVETLMLRDDGSAPDRRTAIAYCLPRFRTERECRHGHMTERYTSSGACIGCVEERATRVDEAKAKLREGCLSKQEAIQHCSPVYLTGQLLECGHSAQQRVIDDACVMCVKEQLDLAEQLLS